jgi:anthranilate phosphoribosyltransferase
MKPSLGPLINPARPDYMIVGVFSESLGPIMARALKCLGLKRAWVVHGCVGLDEISPEGHTKVWKIDDKEPQIHESILSPKEFGLPEHPLSSVRGGNAKENAALMRELLNGRLSGPILDFVLMNAGALIHVAGRASSLKEGVEVAKRSIESGQALKALEAFVQITEKGV